MFFLFVLALLFWTTGFSFSIGLLLNEDSPAIDFAKVYIFWPALLGTYVKNIVEKP